MKTEYEHTKRIRDLVEQGREIRRFLDRLRSPETHPGATETHPGAIDTYLETIDNFSRAESDQEGE